MLSKYLSFQRFHSNFTSILAAMMKSLPLALELRVTRKSLFHLCLEATSIGFDPLSFTSSHFSLWFIASSAS